MPKNVGYPSTKRKLPLEKIANRMSRSDSLSSIGEFGSVVPPAQQDSVRAARRKKPSMNPFQRIADVFKRK